MKNNEADKSMVSPAGHPVAQDVNDPSVPGVGGISGIVMCPFGFQRQPCLKHGCELWVELFYNKTKVGRCTFSWNAILQTESTREIGKINQALVPAPVVKVDMSK